MRPADAPPPMLGARGLVGRRGGAAPVDFELYAGQLLHVRGANGSGKTSLLRTLAGLLRPQAGSVLWRGADARRDLPAYHAGMAFLAHGNGLCAELTAAENLRYALHVAGTPQAAPRIAETLRGWRLERCADVPARRLSQGQSRRLALAAIVLGAKPLWLLDEPDAGLDAPSLAQLHAALQAHLAAGGAAVVASHREPGTAAAQTQTLDMDDYADAGHAVAVGVT
ncbi:heme ABC transporter ATP-binding protein CcmA [Achromobacter sp. HZ01]|uniref:Heme ABC exporter ATP-binding protein CcmA n=1 Tax=Achromobacter pulmonis TaxID=1389932 RepID=A0A2N8KQ39_9BURK|nr:MULTISPECIES: heme ABC exporter ATP-binding protein CcmA [Achromobacter]MBO9328294.1 heme ABC exporter ATP-binding protein CcmA [Achromobacter xylosoxidans]PND35575.1 heme ABC exporter ATP-binding protein CcmA [Achromobacter pulmonis]RAP65859.1 heme ABC transporter ATP-binding protein CcmA [Achromobacter sp. HZ01]